MSCRLILLLLPGVLAAQSMTPKARSYLEKTIGLSAAEIDGLDSGRAAAKVLGAREPSEIAVFSAVRINVPADYLFRAYQNVEKFEPANAVAHGLFHRPPTIADVAKLTLDQKDADAIRKCKPGDCDVQMPADAIARIQGLDWSNPAAQAQAENLQRELIVEYVKRYLEMGDEALLTYHHQKQPQALREGWNRLLEHTPELYTALPQLMKHLREYPAHKSPDTQDHIMWLRTDVSDDRFVNMVCHIFLHEEKQPNQSTYVIGAKLLFANHVLQDGLTLRYLVPAGPSAHYLVALSRSHVPELGGFKGRMLRSRLSGKMRDNLAEYAQLTKQVMEEWYAQHR